MTEEEVKKYAFNLYALYVELLATNKGYAHDPEAHNLCSAVCNFVGGENYEFLAYSNPSGLATNVKKYVLGSLIPTNKINGAIIDRGGMQDLHTEVRLLNYMADQGYLAKTGTISFFSTRSVCSTCAKAIAWVQALCAKNVALIPYELKAETWVKVSTPSSSVSASSASSSSASSSSASSLSASSSSASSSSASSSSASSSSASASDVSVYAYLAQKGTLGVKRDTGQQAGFELKV